tara:strand:- start:2238 stop:3344 length:1107 start_codon:yes stop_codon:yes gene_type:complete
MADSMLDSPIYIGSVLTLFGLGWFFNREDKVMKEAEAIFFAEDYGEPPNNPEPYTFDDTPLPDMMLSYDPQAAIRPFFMRSEDYEEADATLNKLQEDYSLGARLALRDRTYAGDTYVNSYGVLQAPESFYDSSGSLQEDPGHNFVIDTRSNANVRLSAEGVEKHCTQCGSKERDTKLWYTGKRRGLVCQNCWDNRTWMLPKKPLEVKDGTVMMAEYTDISGSEMHDFLKAQGFRVVPMHRAKERIYEKTYGSDGQGTYVIRVYSSVVGNRSRAVGKDAIRVQPVYVNLSTGEDAFLSVHKRVHRVKGWKQNLQNRIDDILKVKPSVVRDSNGKPMVLRKAKRGPSAGSWFWGSRDYPRNKETKRYTAQ